MAFHDMIKKLKAEGLLDKKGNLTQKGHEYTETVKKRYMEKIKPFQPHEKSEDEITWARGWQ